MTLISTHEAAFVAERAYEKALLSAYGPEAYRDARYDPKRNGKTPELLAAREGYKAACQAYLSAYRATL